jgi:hypothetical protein
VLENELFHCHLLAAPVTDVPENGDVWPCVWCMCWRSCYTFMPLPQRRQRRLGDKSAFEGPNTRTCAHPESQDSSHHVMRRFPGHRTAQAVNETSRTCCGRRCQSPRLTSPEPPPQPPLEAPTTREPPMAACATSAAACRAAAPSAADPAGHHPAPRGRQVLLLPFQAHRPCCRSARC